MCRDEEDSVQWLINSKVSKGMLDDVGEVVI